MSAYTAEELARLATEAGQRVADDRAEREAEATEKWRAEESKRLALQNAAPDLLIAAEALRTIVAALAEHIDDEMDLDRDDKPNWAMRLGAQFSGPIGNAMNAVDAAIAKARGE